MTPSKVRLLRHGRDLAQGVAPLLWLLPLLGAVGAAIWLSQPWVAGLFGVGALGVFGWVLSRIHDNTRKPSPLEEEVALTCAGTSIRIGDIDIPRDQIASASITAFGEGTAVEIKRGGMFGPKLFLRVNDWEAGIELLEAMSLDPGSTTAKFWSAVRTRSWQAAVPAVLTLAALPLVFMLGGLGSWAAYPIIVFIMFLTAQRVRVGADGVRVWWMFRERFIPFSDIRDVGAISSGGERGTQLKLHDGTTVMIPAALRYGSGAHQSRVLFSRIWLAWQHHLEADTVRIEALAERNDDEDIGAWIQKLRALRDLTQHRQGAVLADRLWQIVESSAAGPMERAAAAVALGSDLAPVERRRIQEVAKTVAQDKLRVVLEDLDAEDAELEAMLAALEAENTAAKLDAEARESTST